MMTDKRFTIVGEEYVGYEQGNAYIISNGECTFSLWERKEDAQKVCDYLNELAEENEQLKIANAKWLDKSLQDRQIRYSNANHKELTKKYLQLKEENDILKQKLRKNYIANKQYDEMKRLQKENEQQERRIEVLENLLTNIGVKWVDDDD